MEQVCMWSGYKTLNMMLIYGVYWRSFSSPLHLCMHDKAPPLQVSHHLVQKCHGPGKEQLTIWPKSKLSGPPLNPSIAPLLPW